MLSEGQGQEYNTLSCQGLLSEGQGQELKLSCQVLLSEGSRS